NQGGTFTTASQGVNVTSVTVQWNEPTTSASVTRVLRVQETTNAAPSCAGQTDVNVQVNWNPKPAITGNRTVCSNSQYTANNTSAQMYTPYTYVTPGTNQTVNPPASAFAWDVRDVNNVSILTSNPATTVPGARITGTGNQVQVEYFNPTNAPVTMVLRVTESIAYNNASLTPSVKSCPITDSFVVVVNPIPKPIIAPAPTDVCGRSTATYATTGDAGSTFGWTASAGSIVGASNANSVTVTWTNATVDNTPGFIQVAQTFNATGCSTTVRQNVNVDVTPAPAITGPTVICQGTTNGTNTATYSVASIVANRAYLWSIDSPTSGAVTLAASGANNGTSFTVVANGNTTTPVTGVIRLRETSTAATNNGAGGAGCFQETTYTITINPNPTPVITSATGGLNVNGVCAGSTHSYATTNNTANTYSWTVVGGSFNGSSTTNSVSVTWGPAGAGSIAVRERVGSAGCFTDVSTPITIRPLPTPDLTNQTGGQNPTQVCAQGTASYATPNVTGNAYAWTVTGGSISGGAGTNAITVVWGAAGTGSVSVTETTPASLGSCSASRTLSVTINPLPTPSIQGPPSPAVCINSTQTYTTTLTAGRTYQWSGVVGGSFVGATNTNTVNVNWTAAGNGSLTVTETNTTTGCVGTATRTIPVNALPNVTITPSGPTSLCVGGTVTLAATDGFASYTWSTGETTPRITVRQAGTYSVTVIDGNGCRNTSSTITISTSNFTKPTVQLSGTASFCEGESRTLTAQTSGGTPLAYRWNNGATTASITVSTSGTFNVEVTYSNNCKILSDDVTITVSPKPTVSVTASGNTKFCEGGNVVLDAGAGFASYSWKNGTTTVGTGRTLRVTAAGSYTVTVANAAGCTATSTATSVTVNPNPTVTVTASGSTSFCQGDSVTLDAGAGFQSYAWSPGGATTQRITVRNGGSYSVTVTDTNGCTGQSAPKAVQVFPTPQKPGVTRVGNLMTVDTAGKGYTAFQWKLNNNNISGATGASHDAFRTGLGLYKVVITDRNGCTNESDAIRIDTVLDVTDPSALAQGVSLYPNPTTGSLTVKVSLDQDAQAVTLTVRNIVGATVSSYTLDNLVVGENIKPLDLSTLPSGVYMVEVAMPNGKRISARITKVD
ncbi:MAG: T9SS type A sorting domain-containing protein, partial [Candidatus Kapaibacterium sp.]